MVVSINFVSLWQITWSKEEGICFKSFWLDFLPRLHGRGQEEFEKSLQLLLEAMAKMMIHTLDSTLTVQAHCLKYITTTIPDIITNFDPVHMRYGFSYELNFHSKIQILPFCHIHFTFLVHGKYLSYANSPSPNAHIVQSSKHLYFPFLFSVPTTRKHYLPHSTS